MKIILDAMGGDFAPEAPVMGAIDAVKAYGAEITLVGRGEEILAVLKKNGIDNLPSGMEICHADDVQGRRNYKSMNAQRFWDEIGKEMKNHG